MPLECKPETCSPIQQIRSEKPEECQCTIGGAVQKGKAQIGTYPVMSIHTAQWSGDIGIWNSHAVASLMTRRLELLLTSLRRWSIDRKPVVQALIWALQLQPIGIGHQQLWTCGNQTIISFFEWHFLCWNQITMARWPRYSIWFSIHKMSKFWKMWSVDGRWGTYESLFWVQWREREGRGRRVPQCCILLFVVLQLLSQICFLVGHILQLLLQGRMTLKLHSKPTSMNHEPNSISGRWKPKRGIPKRGCDWDFCCHCIWILIVCHHCCDASILVPFWWALNLSRQLLETHMGTPPKKTRWLQLYLGQDTK